MATFLDPDAQSAPMPSLAAAEEPLVEKYLLEGKLAEGEKALSEA